MFMHHFVIPTPIAEGDDHAPQYFACLLIFAIPYVVLVFVWVVISGVYLFLSNTCCSCVSNRSHQHSFR